MPRVHRQSGPKAKKPYSRPTPKATKQTPPKKTYKPYDYPAFGGASNLFFRSKETWDATKLVAGIRGIKFGDEFNITDSHLNALATADPEFRSSLLNLSCGNSDNGYGGSLSDDAVINLSKACPNLISMHLEAATGLTDAALLAIATNCKNVVFIGITGHDKRAGKISSAALKTIQTDKGIAPKLEYLNFTDQGSGSKFDKACKALSKTRKMLAITEGRTDGDGPAAQFVASMTGGEILTTWFGGKEVRSSAGYDSGSDGFW